LNNFKLLAISFAYPPLAYPRSIQVARLLKHLDVSTVIVCADEKYARKDLTLETNAEPKLEKCLRVPFLTSRWKNIAGSISHYLPFPLWNKTPDRYRSWNPIALKAVKNFVHYSRYNPDILVTFSQPISVHLLGLELKKHYGWPWVVHFSDPWVDNPLNKSDPLTRSVNYSLEQKVLEVADKTFFVSYETVDLVMAKYPEEWKKKVCVLPHSFDPELYPEPLKNHNSQIIIRHVGNFYRKRTPKPLFETLKCILSSNPDCLSNVCFELIGAINPLSQYKKRFASFPKGLVSIKPSVPYHESLKQMVSADGLLIIDAPAEISVFLPSKLIDYIGARLPILGFTSPGTSSRLIQNLGGWVADPNDATAMAEKLKSFLSFLRHNRSCRKSAWGKSSVRRKYEASVVAKSFKEVLWALL